MSGFFPQTTRGSNIIRTCGLLPITTVSSNYAFGTSAGKRNQISEIKFAIQETLNYENTVDKTIYYYSIKNNILTIDLPCLNNNDYKGDILQLIEGINLLQLIQEHKLLKQEKIHNYFYFKYNLPNELIQIIFQYLQLNNVAQ